MNVALMLELYRRAAVPFVAESVKLFKEMAVADQAELLFYMIMDFASNKEKQDEHAGDKPTIGLQSNS